MNFVEHTIQLTTQADADAIVAPPVDTAKGPAALESVMFNITAVAGSPTAITLDVNITDGTVTNTPISGSALGTSADVLRIAPDATALAAGTHQIPVEDPSTGAWWVYNFDLNFTGGTTPTVTGVLTFRWRI